LTSPVEVLKENIISTFETADLDSIRRSASSKKISGAIDYDNAQEKVKMPHAKTENRDIYLQETYLSYFWSLIYSLFVIYEEGVQKPLINNQFNGKIDQSKPLLMRARELYEWSISLLEKYSPWDERLPNPKVHNNDKEKYYAEKVNNLFQMAVSYNLFHEFAHLTLGHDSYFDGRPGYTLSESERAERIQLESDADNFAFDKLLGTLSTNESNFPVGVAIIMANVASILAVDSPSQVRQIIHPDIDERLHRVFLKLGLEQESGQFYCWYLGCLAIRLFFMKHGLAESPKEYKTAQDAFASYLQEFDLIKAGNGA
jgi:hypothetical protein